MARRANAVPASTRTAAVRAHRPADLHSRRLAGWAITDHLRTELVIDALHTAMRTRGSLDGSIMHTDHGGQYTSRAFAAACTAAGFGNR